MALRKQEESLFSESLGGQKAKQVFGAKEAKEKKILSTFSIEPSFKEELEGICADMGLGWAAGIRFALKEFSKKYGNNDN